MKLRDASTNAASGARVVPHPDIGKKKNDEPSPEEIRKRAFEIHIERGGIHGCDLDDWLHAESELQEKYNQNNDGGPKKK